MQDFLLLLAAAIAHVIAWWLPLGLLYAYIPGMLWWKNRDKRAPFPWRFYLRIIALGVPPIVWMLVFWRPIYDAE